MFRNAYIGDTYETGGLALQAEARAYFQRMTVPPSAAYREAVNLAIWRWKKAGVWPLILGLWLFCADTEQAALLSVIGDTPRDATKTGAPTFTPLKGFGGFASGGITMPITAAILASDLVGCVMAGLVDNTTIPTSETLIRSDASASFTKVGHFYAFFDGFGGAGDGVFAHNQQRIGSANGVAAVCGGGMGFYAIQAAGQVSDGSGSGGTARSSNYRTNSEILTRFSAHGFISHTATEAQARAFVATLNMLLVELGALD